MILTRRGLTVVRVRLLMLAAVVFAVFACIGQSPTAHAAVFEQVGTLPAAQGAVTIQDVSADGRRLLVLDDGPWDSGGRGAWVVDTADRSVRQLGTVGVNVGQARMSADGSHVAWFEGKCGGSQMFVMSTAPGSVARTLTTPAGPKYGLSQFTVNSSGGVVALLFQKDPQDAFVSCHRDGPGDTRRDNRKIVIANPGQSSFAVVKTPLRGGTWWMNSPDQRVIGVCGPLPGGKRVGITVVRSEPTISVSRASLRSSRARPKSAHAFECAASNSGTASLGALQRRGSGAIQGQLITVIGASSRQHRLAPNVAVGRTFGISEDGRYLIRFSFGKQGGFMRLDTRTGRVRKLPLPIAGLKKGFTYSALEPRDNDSLFGGPLTPGHGNVAAIMLKSRLIALDMAANRATDLHLTGGHGTAVQFLSSGRLLVYFDTTRRRWISDPARTKLTPFDDSALGTPVSLTVSTDGGTVYAAAVNTDGVEGGALRIYRAPSSQLDGSPLSHN